MDVGLIFKIAGIGILILILDKLFKDVKQENTATLVTLAGLVVIFMMVIGLISKLFDSVRTIFQL
jgi:stage III sporulation protein AC